MLLNQSRGLPRLFLCPGSAGRTPVFLAYTPDRPMPSDEPCHPIPLREPRMPNPRYARPCSSSPTSPCGSACPVAMQKDAAWPTS